MQHDRLTGTPPEGATCCTTPRVSTTLSVQSEIVQAPRSTRRQVRLPSGVFAMGDAFREGYRTDGEVPVHSVALSPFWMDSTAVTNAQFATFVKATGYVTEAERFGSAAVFHSTVAADQADVLGGATGARWWVDVRGADWRHPEGLLSTIVDRQAHPVVQVSWHDADSYARWAGKRLPTEAEWEYASRGGLNGARFPWGNDLNPRSRWLCNIWQGQFPSLNTRDDGYLTTAPAKSFYQNNYGMWSMVGNVWEWCSDWFSPTTYADRAAAAAGSAVPNPRGPGMDRAPGQRRVMRGGSFLCHDSYCYRYRCAARSANTPDSSSSNIGFRCANDDEPTVDGTG